MNSNIKKIFATASFALVALLSFSQTKKVETTTFWVAGVCGMCEETIEKAVDTKGVINADYNLENNKLTITYKPKKISLDQIHLLINDAGYDTEKSTCSDAQYDKVHGCCKYRELEKH